MYPGPAALSAFCPFTVVLMPFSALLDPCLSSLCNPGILYALQNLCSAPILAKSQWDSIETLDKDEIIFFFYYFSKLPFSYP